MRPFNCSALLVPVLASCLLLACDPQDEVRKHFASLGLNQLSVARTGIEPGAVFLSDTRTRRASYADNMVHYATYTDQLPIQMRDGMPEFEAVLPSLERATKVDPTLALGFLDAFLPVNVTGSLSFSNDVTISPIAARVKRMRIPTIQDHLVSPQSTSFRQQMSAFQNRNDDLRIAIAYEVYRTNQMRITARSGRDVSSNLEVGAVGPIGSGAFGLQYHKVTTSELLIQGDQSFAFAVRAALIEPVSFLNSDPPLYTISELEVELERRLRGQPTRPRFGFWSTVDARAYSTSIVGDDYQPVALVPLSELGL